MKHDPDQAPLAIYIDFQYLPSHQLAFALMSMELLYFHLIPEEDKPINDYEYSFERYLYSPYFYAPLNAKSSLSVEHVVTGNSITIRFAGRGENSGLNWKGSDAELVAPAWTAAALGVGALLLGGGAIYEKYIETQNKLALTEGQIASKKLIEAQIQKTEAETKEIIERMNKEMKQTASAQRRRRKPLPLMRADEIVYEFRSLVNAPNILKIEINGLEVPKLPATNGTEPQ
jgi:hypothetical protein